MPYVVHQRHRAPAVTRPIPVDRSLPSACVIGAGSSGIAAAKALHMAGVPFDCFERGTAIGGNWLFDNPNGTSACYETLEINTSVRRMAFSDFPMPEHYPHYARHDQVHDYFEQYVDHFGFRDRITFGTEVVEVARGEAGRWRVRTLGPDGEREREYDAVLVANGHHWDPRWPDPAYPGEFAGEQLHAHDYRPAEQLAGRRVVVVGAGNSAMDIAVEASHRAASTVLSIRRGQWVLAKTLLGLPTDRVALPGWLPWWATAQRLRLGVALSGGHERFGLPRPTHRPGQSHPVQSDRIRGRLAAGAIDVRPGIERLAGDRVLFTDGTSAACDLLVWATGYRVRFPFLDPQLVAAEDNELPLWKRAVHPDLPGLFFIGLLQPVGAVMPLAEAQSAWIAELLTGACAMPDEREVREQLRAEHERDRRQFYDSPRHTMEVDVDHYLWDLQRERRRGRARAGRARAHAGRVVAVTGGASGIGREVARQLAAAGAAVAIGDRAGDAARAVAAELGGDARAFDLDVADADSWRAFLADAEAALGPVDVLVHSAGVMWVGAFGDEPEAAVRRQLEVNLLGTVHGVRAAATRMRARDAGHVIAIASAASFLPTPGEASYAASKHGVLGYLRAVREELRGTGVELTAVMPTVVETPLAAGTDAGAAPRLQPADVARAVLQAIERPRFEVSVPGWVGPLHRAVSALPRMLREPILRRMVPDQVRAVDEGARAAYEASLADADAEHPAA
ncbi:SDR family NAD(P)-dependent oxidoreductase [Agrococcus baldri]|uniref:Ketoreductase domain-containing protein n=1 Tax=Agrococcus baldri TaxID=153730 RepID=A0AA87USU7_9MICO|nr:SDR family NAD(P)-dependent oxidoreductase [Agrococcus baldri]GEK81223.1 hypothetical protein ABA31_25740 [Agrococcus baldri]